jgi:hypothetical protein
VLPESTAHVYLASPALEDMLGREIPPDATTEAWNITLALLNDRLSGMPADRFYLGRGIFFWQMLQFDLDLSDLLEPEQLEAWQTWRVPADVSAPGWRPLEDLWQQPSGAAEDELVGYAILVIEYLMERHGSEVMPLILDQMETTESMAEWVAGVSSQPMAAFEPEWREWAINQRGPEG